jgi:hypothetical protein
LPAGTSGPAFANHEHGKLFQTAVDLRVAGDYTDAVIGGTMQLRAGLLGLSLLPQELNARNSPA